MVFNATFNNISAILCQSVLLVEETRVHRENHRPDINHWQSLSEKHDLTQVTSNFVHIMLYRVNITWVEFDLTRLLVIGTDWIGSHIPNYHTKIAWKWWLWWNKINWSTALSYHPIIFLLETYTQVRSTSVRKTRLSLD